MKLRELVGAEDRFIDSARPDALPDQLDRAAHRYCDDDLYGLRKQRAVDRYVLFKFVRPHESIFPQGTLMAWSLRSNLVRGNSPTAPEKGNLNTNAFHSRFRYLNPYYLPVNQGVEK